MDDGIPKYRKKRGRKPPKKADHKHEYEPVIFEYTFEGVGYCAGSRCKTCGKLRLGFPVGYDRPGGRKLPMFGHFPLEDYSDLALVRVKDILTRELEAYPPVV